MRQTLFLMLVMGSLFAVGCGSAPEEDASAASSPDAVKEPEAAVSIPEEPPTPQVYSEVGMHKAIREANSGYTGNGQFAIEGGQVYALSLADCNISDITPLRGLPLMEVDLSGNPLENLGPLRGMTELRKLYLERTNVEDLTPLIGMSSLETLYLNKTNVEDISPLKGLPIKNLYAVDCRVSDLKPLVGMPLEGLWLTGSPVQDISPLAGSQLVTLTLQNTQVSDLSPLAQTSLQRLHIGETPVTDLTPLVQLPLTRLVFSPSRIEKGLEHVRRMPTLRELGVAFDDERQELMPPAQFWQAYDAGELVE